MDMGFLDKIEEKFHLRDLGVEVAMTVPFQPILRKLLQLGHEILQEKIKACHAHNLENNGTA